MRNLMRKIAAMGLGIIVTTLLLKGWQTLPGDNSGVTPLPTGPIAMLPNLSPQAMANLAGEKLIYSDAPISLTNYPLTHLACILQTEPGYARYRIRWGFSMGSYSSSGEAVYDRRKKTIRELISVYDGMSPDYSGDFHTEYTKVTDNILYKAATATGIEGSDPFSFGTLTGYGCGANGVAPPSEKPKKPENSKQQRKAASRAKQAKREVKR